MPHRADHRQSDSLLAQGLRSITSFVSRKPIFSLWLVGMTACLAIGLTITSLKFKTDRADLLHPDTPFQQQWLKYTKSFGETSEMVIAIESDNPLTLKTALEDVGFRMQQEKETFKNVLYRIDPREMNRKGLQYYTPSQLRTGLQRIDEFQPILSGRWSMTQANLVADQLSQQLAYHNRNQYASTQPHNYYDPETDRLLNHADRMSTSLVTFISDRNRFRNPWPDIIPTDPRFPDQGYQTIYLMDHEQTMGFVKFSSTEEDLGFQGPTKAIDRARTIIQELQSVYPDVKMGLTGVPVLENDEMRRSQADMFKATIISLIGVLILLLIGFRGLRHPLLAVFMLGIGMAWAFGYTTLVIGHLNILSLSFAVILIGLGIDYAIHYIAKYLELRHEGEGIYSALETTSETVGVGIVTAAITTSLAFFCATLTQFLGVAELGIIVGGGILLCAIATFFVLPALIVQADEDVPVEKLPRPFQWRGIQWLTNRVPILSLVLSVLVILGIGALAVRYDGLKFSSRVKYDYNLLNLQAHGLESVELQQRMFDANHESLLYAVSIAPTRSEAIARKQQLEQLPTVHHVEDLASRLPMHHEQETRSLVNAFRSRLTNLPQQPPVLPVNHPSQFGHSIERLYFTVRQMPQSSAVESTAKLDQFLDDFSAMSMQRQVDFINDYQTRMSGALLGQLQILANATHPDPVSLEDIPPEIRSRFLNDQGEWLLQVYPKEQIWGIDPLTRFVNDVRTIDPDMTGTPIQNFEASQQIMSSYEKTAFYAFAIVLFVLLIDFLGYQQKALVLLPPLAVLIFIGVACHIRQQPINISMLVMMYLGMVVFLGAILDFTNFRDALLALLPAIGGAILMFGILALLKIDLNPANLIVLPLVLGIGVDDGVHIIHDFRSQRRGYETSSSIINGILLTSFTTIIGFGSLILATHQGLSSVGKVLAIGVACCLFVSLVPLPAILTLIAGPVSTKAHRKSESSRSEKQSSRTERKAA